MVQVDGSPVRLQLCDTAGQVSRVRSQTHVARPFSRNIPLHTYSCVSGVAPWMPTPLGQSLRFFVQTELSPQLLKGMAGNFMSDIHDPQRLKPTDFADALSFHRVTMQGSRLWLLDRLSCDSIQVAAIFKVHRNMKFDELSQLAYLWHYYLLFSNLALQKN